MSRLEYKKKSLLEVVNLNVAFQTANGNIFPVRNMDFQIGENEVVAVIGETGCGKSVFGNSILRLLPSNAQVSGRIFLDGENIMEYSEEEFRHLRGNKISWVPQNPVSSLDPMMQVGRQVEETACVHNRREKKTARLRVTKLLEQLHLGNGVDHYNKYPCELSGGMCQRVLIALGTITHPELIIVDEPTKGLDWTLRKSVVQIFTELKEKRNCAMLLITHDIAVASLLADRIAVMYCGQILESGTAEEIMQHALHPYTRGLLDSVPSRGMKEMKGYAPAPTNQISGCKFNPRCDFFCKECLEQEPELVWLTETHAVRCFAVDKKMEKQEE